MFHEERAEKIESDDEWKRKEWKLKKKRENRKKWKMEKNARFWSKLSNEKVYESRLISNRLRECTNYREERSKEICTFSTWILWLESSSKIIHCFLPLFYCFFLSLWLALAGHRPKLVIRLINAATWAICSHLHWLNCVLYRVLDVKVDIVISGLVPVPLSLFLVIYLIA